MKINKNYYNLFDNISIDQLKKMIKQKELEIKKTKLEIAKIDISNQKSTK